MRISSNNKQHAGLIVILHSRDYGIEVPLYQKIFNVLKIIGKKVILFEFSYIKAKLKADPDQSIEAKELIQFLKKQKYKKLTVIGHSNGGFVALVASTLGLRIHHLIMLGISSVDKDKTAESIAQIMKNMIKNSGKITIIQAEQDEYSSPSQVVNFIKSYKLTIKCLIVPGDHHFKGHENNLAEVVRKVVISF